MENALKFSVGKPAPSIEIGFNEKSGSWIIFVKDNGVGFDMKYHDRIFEIFQRLHRAEDNPVDLDLTMRAFKSQKLDNPLLVARDGEEALAFIEKWGKGEPRPVVILLDLKMPKVNGLEVLQVLKSHPQFKTIPVVVLTTFSESSDVHSAYQLGANSYIVKPVDFEKFLDVARQIDFYWRVLNRPDN